MKLMFQKYFFPASVIYGTSYLSLLGAVYLGISSNLGTMVGLDYPTLLSQAGIPCSITHVNFVRLVIKSQL
jgi:hypothetical protein